MTANQIKALKWWAEVVTATMKKIDLQEKYYGNSSLLRNLTEYEIVHIWEKETSFGEFQYGKPTPIYKNEKIIDEMEAFLNGTTPENILEKCKEFNIEVNDIYKEKPKSINFVEELKEYFATTSREKVLSDWNETAEFDNVGSGINEPIEISQFKYVWLDLNTGEFSNSWSEEQYPNAIDEEMLKTATDKHWKLIKYQCVNEQEFEFYNRMKLK